MTSPRTLLDTSAWVESLRLAGDVEVRSQVDELLRTGSAVLCDMVLLELWNGARGAAELRLLRRLEMDVEIVPTTSDVWSAAIDLSRICRRKGVTIPASDLLIAACARVHDLELLHVDAHFDLIAEASKP